jgi:phosphoribosylaminoimidazolecarboxamide formyltransferase/IMP cyclohydrolase
MATEAIGDLDPIRIEMPVSQSLRYGENPHQSAAVYGDMRSTFEQLHGKELSFNNFLDLSAAVGLIDEFSDADPTVAILKHTNPCGVGTASDLAGAYQRAFATDERSPFGGIVVANRPIDLATAHLIDAIFTEIIVAPGFDADSLELLRAKKNRRLIKILSPGRSFTQPDVRTVLDGLLVQERDPVLPPASVLKAQSLVVTRRHPSNAEWRDLDFAWRVVKHVKSNAIVYARDGATLGIGAGQMSRIDASELAVAKSRKSGLSLGGSVLASDAFFPFADGLLAAAEVGAPAGKQPGG